MAAPKGNRNAAKAKDWESALRKALAQRDPDALRKVADRLLDKALNGDMAAIKEIGDRLDGKPQQCVDNTHTGDVTISVNTGVKRAGD